MVELVSTSNRAKAYLLGVNCTRLLVLNLSNDTKATLTQNLGQIDQIIKMRDTGGLLAVYSQSILSY